MLKIYIFCFFIANTFFLFAQEEQKLIEHIDHASSRERILSLSLYYEKDIHISPARTPQKLDAMLTNCYLIAKKDNDINFKNYLDFYKKTNTIMFLTEGDLFVKEEKVLKIWQEILNQYESSENEHFTAISHVNIGFSLFMMNKYSESLEELLIADEKFRKVGYENFPEMGKHLHNMAMVFYFFRQYEKVAKLMEISVKLPRYDKNRDIQRYYTLGCAYNFLKQYQKAEKAFLKTKQTASLYMDPLWATIASRGMAKVYLNQGKYNEALYL
jgi:tetratricopeptide (TPR) repeat protein